MFRNFPKATQSSRDRAGICSQVYQLVKLFSSTQSFPCQWLLNLTREGLSGRAGDEGQGKEGCSQGRAWYSNWNRSPPQQLVSCGPSRRAGWGKEGSVDDLQAHSLPVGTWRRPGSRVPLMMPQHVRQSGGAQTLHVSQVG